jgi:hypothetical protein
VPRDQYEPNRVLGFPVRSGPRARRDRAAPEEEPQRVAGFPVDWFSGADTDWLGSLVHPIRELRRWLRRRPPGPHAADDE